MTTTTTMLDAARAQIETAIAANGRRWSRRLSWWLDALLVIEESA